MAEKNANYQASYVANPKSTADIERENYLEYQQNAQQYQQQWFAYQQQMMMAYGQYGQPGQPMQQGSYPQQGNYMQQMQQIQQMQQMHNGQPQPLNKIQGYNYQQMNQQPMQGYQNNARGRGAAAGRGNNSRPDYNNRSDNSYRGRGGNQYNRQDNNSRGRGRGGYQRGRGGNQPQTRSSTIGPVQVAPGIKVETSPLFCVNCDKEFNNEGNYKIHMDSHVKCSFCPFEGHPKIISNHEKTIHGPNGYHKINLELNYRHLIPQKK
jgi:hypothetical protein